MTHLEKFAGWKRRLLQAAGAAAGVGVSEYENRSLLEGQQGHGLDRINNGIGAITGMLVASKDPKAKLVGLGGIALKQMQLMQTNQLKRFTDLQIPVAKTNLETAGIANDTARVLSEKAKSMSPQDIGALGLAGAGLAGAGGLGYYLYKTLGAGKEKPVSKIKYTAPTPREGQLEMEIDNTPQALSKQLYDSLRRDAKRRLRAEAKENIRHRPGFKEDRSPETVKQSHIIHEVAVPKLAYLLQLSERI